MVFILKTHHLMFGKPFNIFGVTALFPTLGYVLLPPSKVETNKYHSRKILDRQYNFYFKNSSNVANVLFWLDTEWTMWFPLRDSRSSEQLSVSEMYNWLLVNRRDQVCSQVLRTEIRPTRTHETQVRFECLPGTIKYSDFPLVPSGQCKLLYDLSSIFLHKYQEWKTKSSSSLLNNYYAQFQVHFNDSHHISNM